MGETIKRRFAWLVRDPAFYRRMATLALPMALQNIISFAVGLADNLMVSTLGEAAVGGVTAASQIQNILHMLVMGLGAALVIIATQYYGKRDTRAVKTLCSMALKTAVGAGLIFTLLVAFAGRQVVGIFTDKAEVIEEGLTYIKYVMWSFIFFSMTNVLLSAMRCAGTVKVGLYVSIVTLVTNLGLNYVLIFGKLGFPAMGVAGAALATLISRILEFVVVLIYVRFVDKKLELRAKDIFLFDKVLLKSFVVYGFPVVLGDIFWGIGGAAQFAIIGRMDTYAIAANTIAGNMFQIAAVFVYGIAGAGSLIVGQEIGKDNFSMAKKYTQTLQIIYLLVGVASAGLMLAVRQAVPYIFSHMEPQTLTYASQFMLVSVFTVIGTSYQMSSLQIVRAGGATHFVLVNDLIFVWLVLIPAALLAQFVFHAPPWVVFLCLKCDQVLKGLVAVVKVNRFNWMKNLTKHTEKIAT